MAKPSPRPSTLAPARRRAPRPSAAWVIPGALFGAFLILAWAVHAHHLRGLDQFGYSHLQPLRGTSWQHLTDPVEAPFAALLMVVALLRLRDRPRLAAAWAAAFAASFVIELIGKAVIQRPFANPSHPLWIVHGTFPSGHTMRAVIVAGALAAAWPRAGRPLAAWALVTAALVELTGMHVMSEVAGGLLAGLALVTAVWLVTRRPPAPVGPPPSRKRRAQRRQRRAAPVPR
jgi:membrane-associated phospholipid phosphatase